MKSIVNIKCDIIKKWTIRLLITLGCVLPIFLGCLYFFQFNGVLSPNQNDWVAFGSYIGGVAAITNVGVFVWLTLAIKYDGDKEREKERNHQRKLIISQMRQEELRNFVNVLNDATTIELGTLQGFKFLNASGYILAFMQCFKKLFPILEDAMFSQKLTTMCNTLTEMHKISMTCAGFDEKGVRVSESEPLPLNFNDKIRSFQNLKIEVISKLEEYVIENINAERCGQR